MKNRTLHIGEYSWSVYCYFAVTGYDTRSILSALDAAGCPRDLVVRIRRNLESERMDTGFTYSNKRLRRSVMVVGLASSAREFLNSFEHELRHLCDDVAAASGMSMRGEEVAYLTGYLNAALWDDVHDFVCCCRPEPRRRPAAGS